MTLNFDPIRSNEPQWPINFRLPSSLPNLKILQIYSLDFFNLGKISLDPVNYPKLERIALGYCTSKRNSEENCLNLSNIPIPTVKELEFIGSKSMELLRKAQYLFPNVSSFTVDVDTPRPIHNYRYNEDEEMLPPSYLNLICGGAWKLENFTGFRKCSFEQLLDWINIISGCDGK